MQKKELHPHGVPIAIGYKGKHALTSFCLFEKIDLYL
jgi:hypothetical protein